MNRDSVPELIFIVPYRDRKSQMTVFMNHMKWLLQDKSYEIIISHQDDKRFFNRGAMKNLGFMYAKEKYPYDYKNITFVFHDIDCLVSGKQMTDFQTIKGQIKHIFGFKQTLGGIFSIKGSDFELTNGFPCIWNWGYEDNALRVRWVDIMNRLGLGKHCITYKEFYTYQDNRIIQMWHGDKKIFNKKQAWESFENAKNIYSDGITTITNIIKTSETLDDNVCMVNFKYFSTKQPPPKVAEVGVLNTVESLKWGTTNNKSQTTAHNFRNMFGRRRHHNM